MNALWQTKHQTQKDQKLAEFLGTGLVDHAVMLMIPSSTWLSEPTKLVWYAAVALVNSASGRMRQAPATAAIMAD